MIKQKKNENDSFGMVGIASLGPILAVMILGRSSNEFLAASDRWNRNRYHGSHFGSGTYRNPICFNEYH